MLGCFSQKYIVEKAEDNLAKSIIREIGSIYGITQCAESCWPVLKIQIMV